MSELVVIVGGAAAAFLLWCGVKRRFAQPDFLIAAPAFGSATRALATDIHQWPHLGRFDFEVVDTVEHQAALRSAMEQLGEHCVVTLDACGGSIQNTGAPVAVLIEEVRVGFLSDGDATRFHRRLAYEGRPGQFSQCDARITVVDTSARSDKQSFGIVLDLKPFRH